MDRTKARLSSKIENEYRDVITLPAALAAQQAGARQSNGNGAAGAMPPPPSAAAGQKRKLIEGTRKQSR